MRFLPPSLGMEGSDLGTSIQVPKWTQKGWIQAMPCFGRRTGDQEVPWPQENNVQQSFTWTAELHQNQPRPLKRWWGLNSILCHTKLRRGLGVGPSAHQTQVEMLAAPWIQDQTVVAWEEEQGLCFDNSFCWQAREAAWIASTPVFTPSSLSPGVGTHLSGAVHTAGMPQTEGICNTWIPAVQDLYFPLEQEVKVQISFLNNIIFNS